MDNIPKRRKHKDNPYMLKYDNELNTYQVIFIDSKGNKQIININNEIYNIFNQSELIDLKQMNEFDRHIEHLEHTDEFLYKNSLNKKNNLEDEVILNIQYEYLKQEIKKLPDIQRRRIKMYYFDNMTLKEISKLEKCSIRAVKYSIDIAIEKIKKNIKN